MREWMKSALRRPYEAFSNALFDPLDVVNKARALPWFLRNASLYRRLNRNGSFEIRLRDIWYRAQDRYQRAGAAEGHYFFQDLWAARNLYERKVTDHVDVGSRVDGFVAHILPFCRVRYVDIRPLALQMPGFEFIQGSVVDLPFPDNSIPSLSSLHVIEHIGLGRYGDPVDPGGYLRGARELARVLGPGGVLLLGTPVGRERLCFDAHRIFDPQTVADAFRPLDLLEFHLIDDRWRGIIRDASMEEARRCSYGCGLFLFRKRKD